MGELGPARVLAEGALAIVEETSEADAPALVEPLDMVVAVALRQKRAADVVKLAERAVHLREQWVMGEPWLAISRFALARVLWEAPEGLGRDRGRSLALAQQALDALRIAKDQDKERDEVEAFLNRHSG